MARLPTTKTSERHRVCLRNLLYHRTTRPYPIDPAEGLTAAERAEGVGWCDQLEQHRGSHDWDAAERRGVRTRHREVFGAKPINEDDRGAAWEATAEGARMTRGLRG